MDVWFLVRAIESSVMFVVLGFICSRLVNVMKIRPPLLYHLRLRELT